MRAWNGDTRLRTAVLRQIDEHERIARLEPLVIEGRSLELYGWRQRNDLGALEHALGLPAPLLALGLELFQGFPEDDIGTRDHVAAVRTFLKTAPIGRDLTGVVPLFIASRLTDEQFWSPCGEEIKDLLIRVAMAVLGDEALETLRDEVGAALAVRDDVARDRGEDIGVRRRACEERWALETAHAVCLHREQPARIVGVTSTYYDGIGLPPAEDAGGQEVRLREWMQTTLLSLMAMGGR